MVNFKGIKIFLLSEDKISNRVIQRKNPVKIRAYMAYPHIHRPYYYNYYKIIIYIFICGCPEVIHNFLAD